MSVIMNSSKTRFLPGELEGLVSPHEYGIMCSQEKPGRLSRPGFAKVHFGRRDSSEYREFWVNLGSLSKRLKLSLPKVLFFEAQTGRLEGLIRERALQIIANGNGENPHLFTEQLLEQKDKKRLKQLMYYPKLYPFENSPVFVACMNNNVDALLYLDLTEPPSKRRCQISSSLINRVPWDSNNAPSFEYLLQSLNCYRIGKGESNGAIEALNRASDGELEISRIDLEDAHMTDKQFSDVLKAAVPCHPTSLFLNDGNFSGKALQELEELLPLFPDLRSFGLSFIYLLRTFDEKDAQAMIRGLASCQKLRSLRLSMDNIHSSAMQELATTLTGLSDLATLSIHKGAGWKCGPEELGELADALASLSKLHDVRLPTLPLTDDLAESFAGIISANPSLKKFEIGSKKFGVQAAEAFARAISENESLETFEFKMGKISDTTAQAFAEVFSSHPSLRKVVLRAENLSLEAVKILHQAFSENPNLDLDLWAWRVPEEVEQFLDWENANWTNNAARGVLKTTRHGLIGGFFQEDTVSMRH